MSIGNNGGRPSKYNQDVADDICSHIVDGLSLRAICAMEDMPPLRTLMGWVEKNSEFQQQYTCARRMQADIKFDDLKDLANTATSDNVQCVKLQIDTAKWELSKTLPKKYGDKIDVGLSGKVDSTIKLVTRDIPDDIGFVDS